MKVEPINPVNKINLNLRQNQNGNMQGKKKEDNNKGKNNNSNPAVILEISEEGRRRLRDSHDDEER